jgi:predicted dehydrogenase
MSSLLRRDATYSSERDAEWMTNSPIPIAVVGLGMVADGHITAYRELPDVQIVAVVDPRAERTREVAEKLSVPGFTSCAEMLRHVQPKIGCVLSTVASHRPNTELLANAGVHVLCEKPITNNLPDALAIAQVCERNGVQFMYGSSYRYLPTIVRARELIASGVIGDVVLIEERGVTGSGADKFTPMSTAHYPEGTPGGGGFGMFDHGVHLLDIFPWMIGSSINRVLGRGNYSGATMHTEYAVLEHENGAMGWLVYDEATVSSDMPWEGLFASGLTWQHGLGFGGDPGQWLGEAASIRVHGTKGALRIYYYANRMFLCLPSGTREIIVPAAAAPTHFGRQLQTFVDALRQSNEAPVGPGIGIQALQTLLAIYRSADSRRWETVQR